ncbi:hypothetical protein GCM10010124_10710 [Pilimelia terevasa]|uniref:Uncharacterized protein n=1 Tax=Pilimelia terevasa TaxID=53372 RepID=A0A8J3FIN6_9ACTN|nr:hypothetical protein [Pilimelia terevasa]GGK19948.1 hypothetical protein GCM10010124_10710 [Pilimelia terevasa]
MRRFLTGVLCALAAATVAALAAAAISPSGAAPQFVAAAVPSPAPSAPGPPDQRSLPAGTPAPLPDPRVTPAALAGQLARLRASTDRYASPRAAVRDGFLPAPTCVELPGSGGVGYQYVRPAHVADGVVDALRPEALVYVPTAQGRRLGAVAYLATDRDQDLATDGDRPTLFGRAFDGPTPGRDAMPVHYHLHVWAYTQNPVGIFAPFNPRVSCTVRY